jgi:3D (Asp-Asp-Asp) domain-containing protein
VRNRAGTAAMPALAMLVAAMLVAALAGCHGGAASPAPSRSATSPGWEITVYYTAVEQYHSGPPTPVTGCLTLDCTRGTADLGTFPQDFVQAVQAEGTGVTTDGRYLNWSYDVGYWIDTATRDTAGNPLVPYVTAAADPEVLPTGTGFLIEDCGTQDDGSPLPALVCARLLAARWKVTDEFTPGLGGERHIDVYIGQETGRDFTDSDRYVTLTGATVHLG